MEQYFKILSNKRNSQESLFWHIFFQYDPKEVRYLTNLKVFLVLGYQMINDPLMQPATISFCIFVLPLWLYLLC